MPWAAAYKLFIFPFISRCIINIQNVCASPMWARERTRDHWNLWLNINTPVFCVKCTGCGAWSERFPRAGSSRADFPELYADKTPRLRTLVRSGGLRACVCAHAGAVVISRHIKFDQGSDWSTRLRCAELRSSPAVCSYSVFIPQSEWTCLGSRERAAAHLANFVRIVALAPGLDVARELKIF